MKGFLRLLVDFMSECISVFLSLYLSLSVSLCLSPPSTGDWWVAGQARPSLKQERKEWPPTVPGIFDLTHSHCHSGGRNYHQDCQISTVRQIRDLGKLFWFILSIFILKWLSSQKLTRFLVNKVSAF